MCKSRVGGEGAFPTRGEAGSPAKDLSDPGSQAHRPVFPGLANRDSVSDQGPVWLETRVKLAACRDPTTGKHGTSHPRLAYGVLT